MNSQHKSLGEIPLRRFEYDDSVVFAADVGTVDDVHAGVVDGTVIVIAGDDQYEQELPDNVEARAFINHGVLTIELSDPEEDIR
jgi:hypothetical protein